MTEALICPAVLRWARTRAGLTPDELASGVQKTGEAVLAWEAGSARPTFVQARKLAKKLRLPFGYLFLSEPPTTEPLMPDLRTVGDRPASFSLDLEDVVRDALRKQAWLHDYRKGHGAEPIAWVGRSKIADGIETVATLLHHTFDISKRARESEERMRQLVTACEIAGVIVIRSSTVGSNTSRSLDVDEFRGFALSDPLAPLVFINTADAPAAQPFTLLHELAHLTLGESGVSNMPLAETPNGARDVEMFCNRVAAEFLVPQREFRAVWRSSGDFAATAKALAKQFGVSPMVIARRAHELGLVSADVYWPFVNHQLELARRRRDAQRDSEGGPAFLTLARARNGSLFTQVVVGAAHAGEMLYRDAAALLGVQPKHIDELG